MNSQRTQNITEVFDDFEISTDKNRLDVEFIYQYLSKESYWAIGIPKEIVETSIENSLCFGVYQQEKQIGFARVVSDFATVAYLGDVFILNEFRGRGLSKRLMQAIMSHPELQHLRRWMLLTLDAHGLYQQFGWQSIENPIYWMEIHTKNIYQTNK